MGSQHCHREVSAVEVAVHLDGAVVVAVGAFPKKRTYKDYN